MVKTKLMLSAALVTVLGIALEAKVVPAQIFGDNMVLQRSKAVPIWGTADPGENIQVSFGSQAVSAQANQAGEWMVKLEPMQANAQGSDLAIAGANEKIVFKNVVVGEVWLASGQSNMEMCMWSDNPRWRATNGDKDAAAGANKNIRITTLRNHIWSQLPEKIYTGDIKWEELNAENGQKFSATAFYFAQNIYKNLQIPVGIVASHWSGTRIDPWIPPEGFNSVPELKDIAYTVNAKIPGTGEYAQLSTKTAETYQKWLADFQKAAADKKLLPPLPDYPAELRPYTHVQQSTVIYNRMIYPLLPFAFRGIIWYQGCSNLGEGMLYKYKMHALLNGWRQLFRQDDLAFYFVQLAPYNYGGNPTRLPEIWEAQQAFAAETPAHVNMAVINDVGDYGDIHPHDKATVGKRLGLLALKHTYGKSELKADSPLVSKWEVRGNKFVVEFKNAESFTSKGEPQNFEVAGAAGKWYPAQVKFNGNTMEIWNDNVKVPRMLQYMWHHTRTGNVFNEAALPLGAFRLGSIPEKDELLTDLEKNFQLIYTHNMLEAQPKNGAVKYLLDNSSKVKGSIKRLGYLMQLTTKDNQEEWALVLMDPFTQDFKKIGVPTSKARISFAQPVNNLAVFSNVKNVCKGFFNAGSIEFWSGNYKQPNQYNVAGASASTYDFGDSSSGYGIGYGSMQIHIPAERQTVMAYNNFTNILCDIGIGNSPTGHPDWTFSQSAKKYSKAILKIYALTE